jgi:hypothetical protein
MEDKKRRGRGGEEEEGREVRTQEMLAADLFWFWLCWSSCTKSKT